MERGNAYRPDIEEWLPKPRYLREQICLLYKAVAGRLGCDSWQTLMDDSLASNFCPSRGEWAHLHRKRESIEFSESLWWEIFGIVQPRVIVCCGKDGREGLGKVLLRRGARRLGPAQVRPTYWGDASRGEPGSTYAVQRFKFATATRPARP